MLLHLEITNAELKKQIREHKTCFGGNKKLKIYGTLHCSSGKRMKKENRVFFVTEKEALDNGYRPCGHCMKEKYKIWKEKKLINNKH
ncbi:MAG TPA: Ada metal-binding domain-containing protein [Chitinophagaceae bacterium]|jgi:Metal binding domain of Ada.